MSVPVAMLRLFRSLTEHAHFGNAAFVTPRYLSSAKNSESVSPTSNELTISDSCVRRLKALTSEGNFLRVSVEGGGCSGFQYKFELDSVVNEDDKIYQRDGMKVVVDSTSLEYVKGSTLEYQEELIRSAFRIADNPAADKGCSCGVSFTLKL